MDEHLETIPIPFALLNDHGCYISAIKCYQYLLEKFDGQAGGEVSNKEINTYLHRKYYTAKNLLAYLEKLQVITISVQGPLRYILLNLENANFQYHSRANIYKVAPGAPLPCPEMPSWASKCLPESEKSRKIPPEAFLPQVCKGCGILKPPEEFYLRRRGINRISAVFHRCKSCCRNDAMERRSPHRRRPLDAKLLSGVDDASNQIPNTVSEMPLQEPCAVSTW